MVTDEWRRGADRPSVPGADPARVRMTSPTAGGAAQARCSAPHSKPIRPTASTVGPDYGRAALRNDPARDEHRGVPSRRQGSRRTRDPRRRLATLGEVQVERADVVAGRGGPLLDAELEHADVAISMLSQVAEHAGRRAQQGRVERRLRIGPRPPRDQGRDQERQPAGPPTTITGRCPQIANCLHGMTPSSVPVRDSSRDAIDDPFSERSPRGGTESGARSSRNNPRTGRMRVPYGGEGRS